MSNDSSSKYWLLFGQIALEMGFIDEMQLNEALQFQRIEEESVQEPRVLATILFDKEWMSSEQIDQVLNAVLKKLRVDEANMGRFGGGERL